MYDVQGLTRDLAERHLDAVVELDLQMVRDMGRGYTDEAWEARHFLKDVPGKWEHSALALGPDQEVLGFLVASRSEHPRVGVWLHRLATRPEARGRSLGQGLLEAVLHSARRAGAPRVTLSLAEGNSGALRFFEQAGFRRLVGPELAELVRLRAMPSRVLPECIEEATGHRKLVLALDLPAGGSTP